MCLSNWQGRYPAPGEQQSSQRTGENLQKQSMKHTARSCSEHFHCFLPLCFTSALCYTFALFPSKAEEPTTAQAQVAHILVESHTLCK